jgi:glycosyltransferase involved in cell wall biosynthesis
LIGSKVVLFLGRLHPKKGLDLLIPAFAEVARRVQNVKLVLVGPGDESYVTGLRERVTASGLGERVAFLGPLTGRPKWAALAAAAAFVLPSFQENFAITLVEAMSVGTPVLLSDRVNIWSDVKDANAGVISALDPARIAADLIEVIDDHEFAARLGNNGRALVSRAYNWERTADATEAAYRSALAHTPAAPPRTDEPCRTPS